jgi:hypothetical protein
MPIYEMHASVSGASRNESSSPRRAFGCHKGRAFTSARRRLNPDRETRCAVVPSQGPRAPLTDVPWPVSCRYKQVTSFIRSLASHFPAEQ